MIIRQSLGWMLCVGLWLIFCAAPAFSQTNVPAGERALTTDVDLADFDLFPNPSDFAPENISREGGKIVFSPNNQEPGNNFGFAETMLEDIPDSTVEEANFLVVVVDLSFSVPNNDLVLPTFRARLHQVSGEGEFLSSMTSEMQNSGFRMFQQVASLRVPFDRNRLIFSQRDMILALDFYNFEGANADPDFEITVEDVRYYLTRGDGHSTAEISSVYLTDLGNLFWKRVDELSASFVDQDVEFYAYDNQYLVSLDYTINNKETLTGPALMGELRGFIGSEFADGSGQAIEIAGPPSFDVREAAVNGPFVVFLDAQSRIFVWNFIDRGPPLEVDLSGIPDTIQGVLAADDHTTFQLYSLTGNDYTYYELTVTRDATLLMETPIVNSFAAVLNGRNMLCIDNRDSIFR